MVAGPWLDIQICHARSNRQTRFETARSAIFEPRALANDYFGRIASMTTKRKSVQDMVSEAGPTAVFDQLSALLN